MSGAQDIKAKESKINIDGKEFIIRFTINSFIELEEEFGSIDDALEAMRGKPITDESGKPVMVKVIDEKTGEEKEEQKRKMGLKALRKFLWAGLMSAQPELTEVEVGNMITLANITDIIETITSTLTASLPQAEDSNKNQEGTAEQPKN